jgi:hypothetical protein
MPTTETLKTIAREGTNNIGNIRNSKLASNRRYARNSIRTSVSAGTFELLKHDAIAEMIE